MWYKTAENSEHFFCSCSKQYWFLLKSDNISNRCRIPFEDFLKVTNGMLFLSTQKLVNLEIWYNIKDVNYSIW